MVREATRGSRVAVGMAREAAPGRAVEVGMAREARYGLVLRGSRVESGLFGRGGDRKARQSSSGWLGAAWRGIARVASQSR